MTYNNSTTLNPYSQIANIFFSSADDTVWLHRKFVDWARQGYTIASNISFVGNAWAKEGSKAGGTGRSLYHRFTGLDTWAQNDIIVGWFTDCIAYAVEHQPLVLDARTWKQINSEWTYEGEFAAARRMTFLSIANYFRNVERAKRNRKKNERAAAEQYLIDKQTTTDQETDMSAKQQIEKLFREINEEESQIILWRCGLKDEEQVCKDMDCTQRTLYRKFNALKAKFGGEHV